MLTRTSLKLFQLIGSLTKNAVLPFSPNETVNNLSSFNLPDDELELLKIGLGFSIKPRHLNKTDIVASFEKIHYTMKKKLMDENSATHLKTEIAHLAQNFKQRSKETPYPMNS